MGEMGEGMKNLSRLTWAAQTGPKDIDRRKLPTCAHPGCRKKVEWLGGEDHIDHCFKHASPEEREKYLSAWPH